MGTEVPFTLKGTCHGFSISTIILGIGLLAAPIDWYGPAWSYFQDYIPANGYGMGICLISLSSVQLLALRREATALTLSILFFLGAFVFWTAGVTLSIEGIASHQGFIVALFMLVIGGYKVMISAALWAHYRIGRHQ